MKRFLLWLLNFEREVHARLHDLEVDHGATVLRLRDAIDVRDRALTRAAQETKRLRYLNNAMIVNAGGRVVISPAIMDAGIDSTTVSKTTPDGVEYVVIKGNPKWAR